EGLRIDLKRHGIDVTILSPGFIRRENKKRRPMEVPVEIAAARMVRAIDRRYRSDAFPLRLVLLLAAHRLIPPAWSDAIVTALSGAVGYPGRGAAPRRPIPPTA